MKRMFNGTSGHRTVRSVLHSAVTLGAASALLVTGLMFVSATQASASSSVIAGVDYGPLVGLIGTWKSAPNGGVDVAPGQAGSKVGKGKPAVSPYYETITYTPAGGVVNASEQHLAALYYRQQVFAKSDNKQFHDQTGYLIYDKQNQKVYDTFCIPRGVCVVAEGAPGTTMTLKTQSQGVAETQYMLNTPDDTQAFSVTFTLSGNTLKYEQTTDLQVYGKPFSHTDSDTLGTVASAQDPSTPAAQTVTATKTGVYCFIYSGPTTPVANFVTLFTGGITAVNQMTLPDGSYHSWFQLAPGLATITVLNNGDIICVAAPAGTAVFMSSAIPAETSVIDGIDYGPLVGLIGTWKSAPSGGVDVAPGQSGSPVGQGGPAVSPFYERITYTPPGGRANRAA